MLELIEDTQNKRINQAPRVTIRLPGFDNG